MKEIYSNDNLRIVEENPKIFKIIFEYPNRIVINSLIKTRIIQGATSTDNYRTIKFKAESVKSLLQYQKEKSLTRRKKSLTINEIALLINNLSIQLNYLIKEEYHTIIGYNPEDIIIINDKKFAFIGSELISKLEDNKALISYPFEREDFYVSPELLEQKELPFYVHYKTSYFSLGCLILYVLQLENDFYKDYLKEEIKNINLEILLESHPIKNTKLYWVLSRCLIKDPEKRSILFI
jgi:serine/threonine protein kinase